MDCRATTECKGKSVDSVIRWYVSSWMTMHQSINSQHSSVYCKIPDPVCIFCDKPSTFKRIKVNGYPVQGSYRNRKSKFKDFSWTFQGLFTFFPGVIFHRR